MLIDGPEQALQTIVLAHGAGAGMDSEFMQAMAEGMASSVHSIIYVLELLLPTTKTTREFAC